MSTEDDSEGDVSSTIGDSEADVGDSDADVLSTVSDFDGDVLSTATYLDAEAGDLEGSVYADADVEHEVDEDDDDGVDYEDDTPHFIVNRVPCAAKFTFTLVVVLDVGLHPNSDVWI